MKGLTLKMNYQAYCKKFFNKWTAVTTVAISLLALLIKLTTMIVAVNAAEDTTSIYTAQKIELDKNNDSLLNSVKIIAEKAGTIITENDVEELMDVYMGEFIGTPDIFLYSFHEIEIDVDELMSCYDSKNGELINDIKTTVNTLIDFLVIQMDVNPTIAAAILGNISVEGNFGQQQKTYALAQNYEDYIAWLDEDMKIGYGIAQWTYHKRQLALKDRLIEMHDYMINEGYDKYEVEQGSLFATLVVLTECTFLYDEIQSFELFKNFQTKYSIENATGRIALEYECYKNAETQWKIKNNTYTLISGKGTGGYNRLQNAYIIYDHLLNLSVNY